MSRNKCLGHASRPCPAQVSVKALNLLEFTQMRKILASASLLALSAPAFAVVDVTDVLAEVTDSLTPIGLIGGAVLLVIVGIKAFKWIRRAM